MRTKSILLMGIIFLVCFLNGCTSQGKNVTSRTAQDDPPPFFNSVSWPLPYTVLPEGRLVITGNLQCPGGCFEEVPITVTMFPVAFIEPPVSTAANPGEITHAALQSELTANPTVQSWIAELRATLLRRVTEGPFIDANSWRDITKGLQSRGLFSENFDQYNYFNFQTGDFSFDFDETARLTAGTTLLILSGIDNSGQIGIAMNIFSTGSFNQGIMVAEDDAAIAFANRITGLGNALTQVLAISGDDRGIDIALMQPFLTFVTEVYGNGYHQKEWDIAASYLRNAAEQASQLLSIQGEKDIYNGVVSIIADMYEFDNFLNWGRHFVEINPGDDPSVRQATAVQYYIDRFNEFNEQYNLSTREDGALVLSIQIYQTGNLIANFSVVGKSTQALVVTGYIGQHTIVPEDYNPYFAGIFGVFDSERYAWPPYGI